jgi:hypothetical protein
MLLAPSANRVYTQSSAALAVAEMNAFGIKASTTVLGGHSYVEFDGPLDRLGNLSSAYAFFERRGDLLKPVEVSTLDKYDDDLITIPKYAGKTNEHFTRLLLNATALTSAWRGQFATRTFTVLDPVAGRGTTLNQALMYGWNALGIEVDAKDVDAYAAFLKTWLRQKRVKHSADVTPVRREGRRLGRRFDVEFTATGQHLSLFEADTVNARALLKRQSADLLVADLPYGVVHGARTQGKLQRGPLDLLEAALPGWVELIKPGGAVGLSWNAHVAPRERAMELLAAHGLQPVEPVLGFEHRVDQAILRDALLARR